jgi:hypothetical protein
MRGSVHQRLDTFVDAAFAFSLTLLLAAPVGGADLLQSLRTTLGQLPAFAIGFVILAMFWNEHVAWRRDGGNDEPFAVVLSLLLVFTVLIFVLTLRPMAEVFASFLLSGSTPGLGADDVGSLFRVYGAGFVAMCVVTMMLHLQGRRHSDAPRVMRGRAIIYAILAAAGTLSLALTFGQPTAQFAPWVYPVAGVAVGLFAWRYRWT